MAAPRSKTDKTARGRRLPADSKPPRSGLKGKPKSEPADEFAVVAAVSDQARDDIRLSFLIHDVSRMRRSAYDQFMKPLGITRAQWWVLAHLSRSDGMMQTQLADVLEVGKASLGDVISGLESGGWVERKPDPADKRAKSVFLTPPSQSLIKRMTTMEVQFNNRVFDKLSAADRKKLFEMMLTIKRSISQLSSPKASRAADS